MNPVEAITVAHVDARLQIEKAKAVLTQSLIDQDKAPPLLSINRALILLAQIATVEQVAEPPPKNVWLSERQLQVVQLLADDASSAEIAAGLFISPETVRSHVRHIMVALGVHHRAGLVGKAHKLGLL